MQDNTSYVLLLYIILFGCQGWIWTFCLVFSFIMYKLTANYRHVLVTSQSPGPVGILDSTKISHYVEAVRWMLDTLGVPYKEECHIPVYGVLLGGRTLPRWRIGRSTLGNTVDIVDFMRGTHPEADWLQAKSPEAEKFLATIDSLGVHLRRVVYFELLKADNQTALRDAWSKDAPAWERAYLALPLNIGMTISCWLMGKLLKINVHGEARSYHFLEKTIAETDAMLSDGRRYLFGDQYSIYDILFCGVGYPMVFPDECRASSPSWDNIPAALRKRLTSLRDSRTGQYILRMYREQRHL